MEERKKRAFQWLKVYACLLLVFAAVLAWGPSEVKAAAKLSAKKLMLSEGKTAVLSVTGTKAAVKWSSSNKKVATVSRKGVVRAVKDGKAIITAKAGTRTFRCTVTVKTTRWEKLLNKYKSYASVGQLVFVRYTGGSSAVVELYKKVSGKWKLVLSCSGEVGQEGIGTASEYRAVTPKGVYNLTSGFGIADNPGTKMKYVKVNEYLYWCGDENYYNQLIDIRECPHYCEGEHLIDYPQCYEYGMFFDYNKKNVYGKGSAFFLHVKGNSGYTMGCVAVSRRNMIKILKTCRKGAKICIYPY